MPRLLLLAGALLLIGARSPQAASVPVRLGEEVTLALDSGGRVTEVKRGSAEPLDAFEQKNAQAFSSGKFDWATGSRTFATKADEGSAPRPVQPGKLRLKFTSLPDGGSFLILYNGYRRAVSYRAVMHRTGGAQATDVCQVLPMLRATEYWPYAVEQLDLSAFRLDPWTEGAQPLCG